MFSQADFPPQDDGPFEHDASKASIHSQEDELSEARLAKLEDQRTKEMKAVMKQLKPNVELDQRDSYTVGIQVTI